MMATAGMPADLSPGPVSATPVAEQTLQGQAGRARRADADVGDVEQMLAAGDVDAVLVGRVTDRRRDVGCALRRRRAGREQDEKQGGPACLYRPPHGGAPLIVLLVRLSALS